MRKALSATSGLSGAVLVWRRCDGAATDAGPARRPSAIAAASDSMSNCSSVTPGGIEVLHCLQQNSARLSSACRSAVNAISIRPRSQRRRQPLRQLRRPPIATATAESSACRAHRQGASRESGCSATTHQPGQRTAIRAACQSDFIARCPRVQPGGAQALQCLQGHAPELAAACRQALAAIAPGAAASMAAAPAVAPPVAVEPVAVVGPIPPLPLRVRVEILNICRAEQVSLCGGVPAGGGRLVDCLVANQASISPGCRRALLWACC